MFIPELVKTRLFGNDYFTSKRKFSPKLDNKDLQGFRVQLIIYKSTVFLDENVLVLYLFETPDFSVKFKEAITMQSKSQLKLQYAYHCIQLHTSSIKCNRSQISLPIRSSN